tara:strand:- start:946 stop:1365 length:420 start_codon:yes stop_codon:yes gene_type:complete
MAISQGLTTLCKEKMLKGGIDFTTVEVKLALFTNEANLDATTTTYTGLDNQITGDGYVSGGNVLVVTVATTGTTAYVHFNDSFWSNATFTAAGGLIYNNTVGSKDALAVLDFGGNKTVTAGTFLINFPAAGDSAIIRIE